MEMVICDSDGRILGWFEGGRSVGAGAADGNVEF